MNEYDTENNTRLLAVSNTLVEAKKVKQGTLVTMGCSPEVVFDIMNGKSVVVLMILDSEEFEKRKNEK